MNKSAAMIRSIGLLLILIFLSGIHLAAQEQEKPEPPARQTPATAEQTREGQERLPEFELPEFVITGRATFRLPPVQKPKASENYVYVAEVPDKMPAGAREIDTTPVDLPDKSFGEFADTPLLQNGFARLGYGRFNSPHASGWTHFTSGQWDASAQLDYFDTRGFEPFAEGKRFDGRITGGYRFDQAIPFIGGGRTFLTMGLLNNDYYLKQNPIYVPLGFDPLLTGRKLRSGLTEIGLTSGPGLPFDYEFRFGWRGSTIEDEQSAETSDDEITTRLKTLGYISDIRLQSEFLFIVNYLDRVVPSADPNFLRTTVKALVPLAGERLHLELGGSVYYIRPSNADFSTLFKPFGELRFTPAGAISLYARFEPQVLHRSLYQLREMNPYVSASSIIRHAEESVNLSGGIIFTPSKKLQLHGYAAYLEIEDYPTFDLLLERGMFTVDYTGTTSIASLAGEMVYSATSRDLITAQLVIRRAKNSFYETTVPYLPAFEAAAVYTRDFSARIRGSAALEILGARRPNFSGAWNDLDAFANISLDVQYRFHNIMGVYLSVDNMLDHTYSGFIGYPMRPFYIEGGIQLVW